MDRLINQRTRLELELARIHKHARVHKRVHSHAHAHALEQELKMLNARIVAMNRPRH